jgi:hypothetical protein
MYRPAVKDCVTFRQMHCDRRKQIAARTNLIALIERLLAASQIEERRAAITGRFTFLGIEPA